MEMSRLRGPLLRGRKSGYSPVKMTNLWLCDDPFPMENRLPLRNKTTLCVQSSFFVPDRLGTLVLGILFSTLSFFPTAHTQLACRALSDRPSYKGKTAVLCLQRWWQTRLPVLWHLLRRLSIAISLFQGENLH